MAETEMEQNGGATGGYEGGEDDRQLYVGNELKDLFKEIGDVEFADIPRSNGHRSRGFGIVRFRTAEDAIKAVEKFNDFEWKGRKLAVRVDKMVTKRSGFTLFVGNLSWSVHWQDLKDFARDHGCPPARADVQFGSDGRSRGWGTLGYDTEEEMQKAVSTLNGLQFNSRIIEVREDRKPGRF